MADKIPEADEKGAGEKGLRAAAGVLLASRSYKTPEPEMVLVSINSLAALALAIDNPSLASVILSTGRRRQAAAAHVASVGEEIINANKV